METASLEQIIKQARTLISKRILDFVPTSVSSLNKGSIGNLIQQYGFNIPVNNNPSPDFKSAEIELKVVPLSPSSRGIFKIKERTKICSISYHNVVGQLWENSHVKKKLMKILFVFYLYDKRLQLNSKIIQIFLFDIRDFPNDEKIFIKDYNTFQKFVTAGQAHLISESEFTYLAASTSGSGGTGSIVKQPYSKVMAKKRSFSLKPSYTTVLLKSIAGMTFDSLFEKYRISGPDDVFKLIQRSLEPYVGRNLLQTANKLGIEESTSKDFMARIIRRALGFTGKYKPIKEIEQMGLTIKAIPFDMDSLYPKEGLSFPHQPFADIVMEPSFEESLLASYVCFILVVPILKCKKNIRPPYLGKPFIWKPSIDEKKVIHSEWLAYRKIIKQGIIINKIEAKTVLGYKVVTNFPKESQTRIIHMRPHGRDGRDIDESILPLRIVKHSFWINKSYLNKLSTDLIV